jgi:hypothetical protein
MALTTQASALMSEYLMLMASKMQDEDPTDPFWPASVPDAANGKPYTKLNAFNDWLVRCYEGGVIESRPGQFTGNATFGAIAIGTRTLASVDARILKFMHSHIETAGGNYLVGAEIEAMAPNDLRSLQAMSATPGTPLAIAYERVAAPFNSSQPGFWTAWLWPIPVAQVFVSAMALTTPYVCGAVTDRPDCTDAQGRLVATLAAIDGAARNGRASVVEALWREPDVGALKNWATPFMAKAA